MPKDIGWGWYELSGLFSLIGLTVITLARVLRGRS